MTRALFADLATGTSHEVVSVNSEYVLVYNPQGGLEVGEGCDWKCVLFCSVREKSSGPS